MFTEKNSVITIVGIILLLCCLMACGLSENELALLDNAAEQKHQKAILIFESGGLKAAAAYCKTEDKFIIRGESFTVNCTVATNLYKHEEDVIKVEGNKTILPVSLYLRIDHRSIGYLDEGYLFRNTTISAFARDEKRWFYPIITKRKDFK
jgi:hypothetical protein